MRFRRSRIGVVAGALVILLGACNWSSYLNGPLHWSFNDGRRSRPRTPPALRRSGRGHPTPRRSQGSRPRVCIRRPASCTVASTSARTRATSTRSTSPAVTSCGSGSSASNRTSRAWRWGSSPPRPSWTSRTESAAPFPSCTWPLLTATSTRSTGTPARPGGAASSRSRRRPRTTRSTGRLPRWWETGSTSGSRRTATPRSSAVG